jgi:hypothetical protein
MLEHFLPWLRRIESVTKEQMHHIIQRIPTDWISAAQGDFAVGLMCAARDQLLRIKLS